MGLLDELNKNVEENSPLNQKHEDKVRRMLFEFILYIQKKLELNDEEANFCYLSKDYDIIPVKQMASHSEYMNLSDKYIFEKYDHIMSIMVGVYVGGADKKIFPIQLNGSYNINLKQFILSINGLGLYNGHRERENNILTAKVDDEKAFEDLFQRLFRKMKEVTSSPEKLKTNLIISWFH
jgi:hypothetical protein